MENHDYIEVARKLAYAAHEGDTDKAGLPYILHPQRVATYVRMTGLWCGLDPFQMDIAEQIAWLHDTDEDTWLDFEYLMNFSALTQRGVRALTRTADRPGGKAYYGPIRVEPVFKAVKWADMIDNTDPRRLALLDPKDQIRLDRKYIDGAEMLGLNPTPKQWWADQMEKAA